MTLLLPAPYMINVTPFFMAAFWGKYVVRAYIFSIATVVFIGWPMGAVEAQSSFTMQSFSSVLECKAKRTALDKAADALRPALDTFLNSPKWAEYQLLMKQSSAVSEICYQMERARLIAGGSKDGTAQGDVSQLTAIHSLLTDKTLPSAVPDPLVRGIQKKNLSVVRGKMDELANILDGSMSTFQNSDFGPSSPSARLPVSSGGTLGTKAAAALMADVDSWQATETAREEKDRQAEASRQAQLRTAEAERQEQLRIAAAQQLALQQRQQEEVSRAAAARTSAPTYTRKDDDSPGFLGTLADILVGGAQIAMKNASTPGYSAYSRIQGQSGQYTTGSSDLNSVCPGLMTRLETVMGGRSPAGVCASTQAELTKYETANGLLRQCPHHFAKEALQTNLATMQQLRDVAASSCAKGY